MITGYRNMHEDHVHRDVWRHIYGAYNSAWYIVSTPSVLFSLLLLFCPEKGTEFQQAEKQS